MRYIFLFIIFISILSAGSLPADYFQQHVTYDIQVTLDDRDHLLDAHESIQYTNNSPDVLNFIWFHIWPNAYRDDETAFAKQKLEQGSTRFHFSAEQDRGAIDNLNFTVDGQTASWSEHPQWTDVVKLILPEPLQPGGKITIETPFQVKLPKVFSRLGHTDTHYEITQWYPKPAVYDRDGWHPMPYLDLGEFYSEFGSFDVHITLPEDYVVMATGDLVNSASELRWLERKAEEGKQLNALSRKELKKWVKKQQKRIKKRNKAEEKSGKSADTATMKTIHFHQDNVHDFAWFADRDYIVQKGRLTLPDSERTVTLWSACLPKNAENWRYSIQYLEDSGYWYSTFYGDYPYHHITAVDGDLSAGGGMEYPNITVIAAVPSRDLLEMVIMHEVGHNWVYSILGSNERDHPWMDEGLNEYNNVVYWKKKYGWSAGLRLVPDNWSNPLLQDADLSWLLQYLNYQLNATSKDDQPANLSSEEYHPGNYGAIIYGKVGAWTYYLHHFLGERKMFEILHDYYDTWQYRHPGPQDFRDIVEEHVDLDLDWYFNGVMSTTETVDYAITHVGSDSVTIENRGTLAAPLQLAFCDMEKGLQVDSEWHEGFQGEKTIPLAHKGLCVRLDPYEVLPDIDRTNNVSRRSCVDSGIIFDKPNYFSFYLGNLVPTFALNSYNKALGVGIYRGVVPREKINYAVMPAFDFANSQIVGMAKIQYNLYRWKGMDEFHPFVSVTRRHGRNTILLGMEAILRDRMVSEPRTTLKLENRSHYFHAEENFNPAIWAVDESINSIKFTAEHFRKLTPLIKFRGEMGARFAGSSQQDAATIWWKSSLKWQVSRKMICTVQVNATHLLNGDLPQYIPFVQGSADPDFETFTIDHSANGDLTVIGRQYINDVASMRIAPANTLLPYETGAVIGMDISGINESFGFFADAFVGSDPFEVEGDSYNLLFSAGILADLGFLNIYVPFYMNWGGDIDFGSRDWTDHIRAEVTFSLSQIRVGM